MAITKSTVEGVEFHGDIKPGFDAILTDEAIAFVAELERRFGPERLALLARREETQTRLDAGWRPDFLDETREIRESDLTTSPVPDDIKDRRVEITVR